jgi:hypothetical protein
VLERWLRCVLYYSSTLRSPSTSAALAHQAVLEATALMLDLVFGVVLQLQSSRPRWQRLLDALRPPTSVVRDRMHNAVERLAQAAAAVPERGRGFLEELLLGQGMLLRWLGAAELLEPTKALDLLDLASCMLFKKPVAMAEQKVALAVDERVARQVNSGLTLSLPATALCNGPVHEASMIVC